MSETTISTDEPILNPGRRKYKTRKLPRIIPYVAKVRALQLMQPKSLENLQTVTENLSFTNTPLFIDGINKEKISTQWLQWTSKLIPHVNHIPPLSFVIIGRLEQLQKHVSFSLFPFCHLLQDFLVHAMCNGSITMTEPLHNPSIKLASIVIPNTFYEWSLWSFQGWIYQTIYCIQNKNTPITSKNTIIIPTITVPRMTSNEWIQWHWYRPAQERFSLLQFISPI
jgi:hypothetical protein